jgi:hypothetical protein
MPVNSDGTDWHQSHAFGDFCYICHGGNNQATDKDQAHEGMVSPLSDINASCQQCHYSDLEKRAQVYASVLGVDIGTGDSPPPSENDTAPPLDGTTSLVSAPVASDLVVDDPNVVDYVKRYNEIVLGQKPINIGNAILIVLIILLIIGGGGFVLYNEGWIRITTEPLAPVPQGYPTTIVKMLPKLQKMSAKGRQGLNILLEEPESADELLDVLAHYTHKGA